MKTVNVHEAKTNFSRILAKVQKGQEVIIAKAGKPVARLVPIQFAPPPRKFGTAKGQVWMSDDFDAPLPDDIIESFYK